MNFKIPLTAKLAFRNILRNRRRTLLTGLSLFAGYVLLVVSFSIQDGTYHNVLATYTQDSSGHIQITHKDYLDKPTLYRNVSNYQTVINQLENNDDIKNITTRIHSTALAYGQDKTALAVLKGISVEREPQVSFIKNKIKQGRYLKSSMNKNGYYEAMIGQGLAKQLGLNIGDELVLISQGVDGSMANDVFIVAGLIGELNSPQRFDVYLPLVAMQQFLVMPNAVHNIIILLDDYLDAESVSQEINKDLSDLLEKNNLAAYPWQTVEKEFNRVMKADKDGNKISMYIVVFLVCLGVLNTILMSILERTGEFGVLKAIGTQPSRIFWAIILESQILAALCCFLGLLVALPINAYFTCTGIIMPEPMEISGIYFNSINGLMSFAIFFQPFVIILLATLFISFWPAYRASRINPLDAMRAL